ncbi:MAG: hypothetical protein R3C44_18350 [Chloroflexota bacterium]
MLFWLLLTLHLYILGRDTGHRLPLVLAWVTIVLALLTHENGLIALPALAGVEWVRHRPETWRDWIRPLWPYAVPVVVYVPLWLMIPKDNEAVSFSLSAAAGNTVPFMQSLVYPLLPVLRLNSGNTALLVLLVTAVIVVTGVLALAL